jgi:asparagine synthase (glutamine-hydrolysing)
MCGIAGYVGIGGNPDHDKKLLERMARSIQHRGPDDEGFYRSSGVGLAHRRLSIIDLHSGRQPIANEDNSIQLVFNGEIYNYQALRRDLIRKGHRFSTKTDTEVIVHISAPR